MDQPARPLGALHRRLVARLLDALTVFAILFALVVVRVFWYMDSLSDSIQPDPWGRGFVATVTFVALFAVYETVFVSQRGQTPGKDAMKLKVVGHDDDQPPNAIRAALRWALPGALCLVHPIWLAALAVTATGATALAPGRRAVHDLIAGTRVVVYDADVEEPESVAGLDRDELRRTYGPRSLVEALFERVERRRDD